MLDPLEGAQEVSFALLFTLPQLPPTLSYMLNRKHQASRDRNKDPSTSPWEGPVTVPGSGPYLWLCVLALTPATTPPPGGDLTLGECPLEFTLSLVPWSPCLRATSDPASRSASKPAIHTATNGCEPGCRCYTAASQVPTFGRRPG